MEKSNYEVEVLINGKPLKEYIHHGKVYVEGREGSTFSIRLRNNSGQRKLFIPSVDGLSVMNGEECSFNSSGYIVRPYSAITIEGWRVSDAEVAQFYFSAPNDSYRKRISKGNNLGVIGCAVFDDLYHERFLCGASMSTSGTRKSMDDISFNASNTLNLRSDPTDSKVMCSVRSSQDLGTGWGEQKRSEVISVAFERANRPAATFEIYYNTREQLENVGVDFKREPLYVSPQAFPGQYCEPPKR